MSAEARPFVPMFSIDVSAEAAAADATNKIDANELICVLLKQLVEGQQREIKLLEEISFHVSQHHKQRQVDIAHWKDQNPDLARSCRIAAEALVKVQNQFIHEMTEEVADNHQGWNESEYMLSEFVDRFGPRLAHLNGVLQVLSQLATPPVKEQPARVVE